MKKYLIIIAAFLLIPSFALAETHIAASCSYDNVKTKYDLAADEDIVAIPAGDCTWPTRLTINKNITLQGTGRTTTIIRQTSGVPYILISGTKAFTIRGIGFVSAYSTYGIDVNTTANDWRITDCSFKTTATGQQSIINVYASGNTVGNGLIDNNSIENGHIQVSQAYSSYGWASWANALDLGGSSAVYIENNTFIGTFTGYVVPNSVIDANLGGRTVFRYNTLVNCYLEQHSVQGDNNRAARKWEIYNNSITYNNDRTQSGNVMSIRGGTGVIFNNNITNGTTFGWNLSITSAIKFDNRRSSETLGTYAGMCDGDSAWDGNTENYYGWPCRDQIGRSTDSQAWVKSDAETGTQASEPAYVWNNTYNGSPITVVSVPTSGYHSYHIVKDRDYFVGTTAKPEYTPYTCPHPLADPSAQGSCATEGATMYGTTGYTLTGGASDTTAPTVLSVYVNGANLTINFSESITATSGAAFTLDPSGADVTVSCPAVATAATSMTCTISRALTAAETATYAYTGTKVVDVAENALATIEATNITLNQTPAEAPTKKLTISKTGTGCTITSSPSGISCGSTCEFDFTTATQVTLGGYLENGWASITYSGGCAGGAADLTNDVANCTVTCTPIYLLN